MYTCHCMHLAYAGMCICCYYCVRAHTNMMFAGLVGLLCQLLCKALCWYALQSGLLPLRWQLYELSLYTLGAAATIK